MEKLTNEALLLLWEEAQTPHRAVRVTRAQLLALLTEVFVGRATQSAPTGRPDPAPVRLPQS
jgi:hypothetical protein